MISRSFRSKNGPGLVLMFIGLLWFGALHLRALDRYVVEPGTIAGGNGGVYSDWSIAATQIQWAVDASTNASDTIWVSNGTYVLTNQIVVISNIVLQSTNGPEVTIVNGGFVAGLTDATTNNRCLYLSNLSALVSGFTFSNGAVCATGGAGVWIGAGTLSNCTVRDNTAFNLTNTTGSISGGGIFMKPRGTVTTCRVFGNIVTNGTTALYGGGAGICTPAYDTTPRAIINCLVSNNIIKGVTDSRSGGGINAYSTIIRSCMICNNDITPGGIGGGVYMRWYSTLESSTLTLNRASSGAGCYLAGGIISNCVISYNYISDADSGGGINVLPEISYMYARVLNTTITGNTNTGVRMSNYSSGTNQMINCIIESNANFGLVIRSGAANTLNIVSNCVVRRNKAGVRCYNTWDTYIRNCLIVNNYATNNNYGGLYFGSSSCTNVYVSGCTIASNWTTNYGAGLRFESTNAQVLLSSCIIYSNGIGGTNDLYDDSAPTNYGKLQYSCAGTNPGFNGAGIIVTNPQFVSLTGADFRLSANSPCINAGSNEPWMTNAVDLDGRARICYGTVDMGAYEKVCEGTVYGFQ